MLSAHPIRVVFMGSDELSCPFLTALANAPDVNVVAVVTQPDRGKGRHLRVQPGPVKVLAQSRDIPVLTPVRVNSPIVMETLAGLGIDAIVVMAYGQFLGDMLLSLPPFGCINLHVSLLPRWRGATPIHRAILAGDTITGVTAMMMDRGMDTGDILGQVKCPIAPTDTTGSIGTRLSESGSDLMLDVLRRLANGTCPRIPQDPALVTFAPKIQNAEEGLDWTKSAVENERKIRAFSPRPGAATYIPGPPGKPGMRLKVMAATVEDLPKAIAFTLPGTLLEMDPKKGPLIAGGSGRALRLTLVRPEGGKIMSGAAFANGYRSRTPIGIRFKNLPAPPPPNPQSGHDVMPETSGTATTPPTA